MIFLDLWFGHILFGGLWLGVLRIASFVALAMARIVHNPIYVGGTIPRFCGLSICFHVRLRESPGLYTIFCRYQFGLFGTLWRMVVPNVLLLSFAALGWDRCRRLQCLAFPM